MNISVIFRQQKSISANNNPHNTANHTRCERVVKPLSCPHSHAASIQTTSVTMANPTGGNRNNAAMTTGINTKQISGDTSAKRPHQAVSSPGSVPPKRRSRLAKAFNALQSLVHRIGPENICKVKFGIGNLPKQKLLMRCSPVLIAKSTGASSCTDMLV